MTNFDENVRYESPEDIATTPKALGIAGEEIYQNSRFKAERNDLTGEMAANLDVKITDGLESLLDSSGEYQEHVGTTLGAATGYLLTQSNPDAYNAVSEEQALALYDGKLDLDQDAFVEAYNNPEEVVSALTPGDPQIQGVPKEYGERLNNVIAFSQGDKVIDHAEKAADFMMSAMSILDSAKELADKERSQGKITGWLSDIQEERYGKAYNAQDRLKKASHHTGQMSSNVGENPLVSVPSERAMRFLNRQKSIAEKLDGTEAPDLRLPEL